MERFYGKILWKDQSYEVQAQRFNGEIRCKDFMERSKL